MKIFVKTRESLARRSIRRKMKSVNRDRSVHNFSNSERIGIYYETTSSDEFNLIRQFTSELEKHGIRSLLLGYADAEEVPSEMTLRENCRVFLPKELDMIYRPKCASVETFISKDFDILFDFSMEESIPGYYVTSLSKASFKVGRYREEDNDIDFMIDINRDKSLKYLIEQVITYVSMLNKPEK